MGDRAVGGWSHDADMMCRDEEESGLCRVVYIVLLKKFIFLINV